MSGRFRGRGVCAPGVAIAACLALSACAGDVIPQGKHLRGHGRAPSAAPRYGVNSPEFRQCAGKLAALGGHFTPLPDRSYGGGCSAFGAVRLDEIIVPVTGLGSMTCPVAQHFTAWARYGVAPAARIYFGVELVRIDTFGTYNCRVVAGSDRLSEHGRANAIDIAAFLLADGRRISVQNGWNGDDASRAFLRAVRTSACRRFRTVLSPDYNAAHHDHLHFDMGGRGGYCR
ncbi:MAG: extensin family protein [Sphingomonadaceae bacterium]|nr:extensin family protein [Sphingomonadaceae bacterium]